MTAPVAPSANIQSANTHTSNPQSKTAQSELVTLATWMAGDFSNLKQVDADPVNFAHIRIFFRPLPYDFFEPLGLPGSICFYSEQTYDYDLWRPYRQGLHRVIAKPDHVYIENYGLVDGLPYAGSGHNADILKTLTPQCATRRQGCSMVFRRDDSGQAFIGGVEPGNNCRIPRDGKMTYLVSQVEVTDQTWVSLDQGMDIDTGEHVWGSTEGALRFEKRTSFADELPLTQLQQG